MNRTLLRNAGRQQPRHVPSPCTARQAPMMAATERSASASLVAQEVTERRMIHSPFHCAPAAKQVPSAWIARDHLAGQDIVGGVVAAEAHDDLVQLHLVQHADAGFLAQRLRHAARDAAVMRDQLRDAAAAERADHRPGGEAAGAARKFRHVVRWVALAGGDRAAGSWR